MFNQKLAKNIEKKVGLSLKEIREKSPGELRRYIEKKNGRIITIRGNVSIENLITREEINKQVDILLGLKN